MSLGTRKTKTEGSGNVLRRRRTILAWGFALPFAVVFCVFMLIPLLSSMAMSFTDITSKDLRTPFNVNFVGLDQSTSHCSTIVASCTRWASPESSCSSACRSPW